MNGFSKKERYAMTRWTILVTVYLSITLTTVADAAVWYVDKDNTDTSDPVVTMAENAHLYGGFDKTESVRADRDWAANVTTIDGEEARRGVVGENSATLNGFSVRNGRADKGGGMYNSSSSLMVTNCTFTGNWAFQSGGIYNEDTSLLLENCIILGNRARWDQPEVTPCRGGSIYNVNTSLKVI